MMFSKRICEKIFFKVLHYQMRTIKKIKDNKAYVFQSKPIIEVHNSNDIF